MLVRAKRLGWDELDGKVTRHDELDPPAWADDGASEWVEGELAEETVPADGAYRERRVCTVSGQLVNPATVQEIRES